MLGTRMVSLFSTPTERSNELPNRSHNLVNGIGLYRDRINSHPQHHTASGAGKRNALKDLAGKMSLDSSPVDVRDSRTAFWAHGHGPP